MVTEIMTFFFVAFSWACWLACSIKSVLGRWPWKDRPDQKHETVIPLHLHTTEEEPQRAASKR